MRKLPGCGVRALRSSGLALAATPLLLGSVPDAAAAITGVCPDGSVFVVQHEAQIPCREAREVEPHEVPPLRPEYLSSPYTWNIWKDQQDPNNPYNLVDAVRRMREMQIPGATDAAPGVSSGPPGGAAARENTSPLDLGLGDEELRNLFLIVELSQEQTPVSFARDTADGRGVFRVAFAHSQAFEVRLQEAWASRGGLGGSRVLLFTGVSKQPAELHPNFTFVQGHLSYQPDPTNPRQLGVLQGRVGPLEANEVVLGYVVLPETIDLGGEMDVYWDDRRATARFGG
jgi:hypothetical protein